MLDKMMALVQRINNIDFTNVSRSLKESFIRDECNKIFLGDMDFQVVLMHCK